MLDQICSADNGASLIGPGRGQVKGNHAYQTPALKVAVQCVAAQIKAMHRLRDGVPGGSVDLAQLLVDFECAAADLRQAYLVSQAQQPDLPTYAELVQPFKVMDTE